MRIARRIAAWNLSMCRPPSFAAVYAPRRFFMRAGGLPCGGVPLASPGLNPGGTYSPNKKGTRRGGLALFAACRPSLSLPFCPLSPQPPSPAGKGETKSLFRRGLRPRRPCTKPFAALAIPATVVPCGGLAPATLARPANPAFDRGLPSVSPVRRKTDRIAFLWTVPAAKERGDRGRGTSAFEMVLSPGAGIVGDQNRQAPPLRTPQRRG